MEILNKYSDSEAIYELLNIKKSDEINIIIKDCIKDKNIFLLDTLSKNMLSSCIKSVILEYSNNMLKLSCPNIFQNNKEISFTEFSILNPCLIFDKYTDVVSFPAGIIIKLVYISDKWYISSETQIDASNLCHKDIPLKIYFENINYDILDTQKIYVYSVNTDIHLISIFERVGRYFRRVRTPEFLRININSNSDIIYYILLNKTSIHYFNIRTGISWCIYPDDMHIDSDQLKTFNFINKCKRGIIDDIPKDIIYNMYHLPFYLSECYRKKYIAKQFIKLPKEDHFIINKINQIVNNKYDKNNISIFHLIKKELLQSSDYYISKMIQHMYEFQEKEVQ